MVSGQLFPPSSSHANLKTPLRGQYAHVHHKNTTIPSLRTPQTARPLHTAALSSFSIKRNPEILQQRSWKSIILINTAILIGFLFGLAHHLVNAHLSGRQVSGTALSQEWSSRIATSLAFATKLCFVTAVGISFVQWQWLKLRRNQHKIGHIDAMTNVLEDLTNFFYGSVWLKNPVLTLLAVISWTIPLAAIISPGSLTVGNVQTMVTGSSQVPQIDFTLPSYAFPDWYDGNSPRGRIQQAVNAGGNLTHAFMQVLSGGQMLTLLGMVKQNQTYHLNFWAPVVKCQDANQSMIEAATYSYGQELNSSNEAFLWSEYCAWIGEDTPDTNMVETSSAARRTLDQGIEKRVFFMTQDYSNGWNKSIVLGANTRREVNVTECRLYNGSYSSDFSWQAGVQTINTTVTAYQDPFLGEFFLPDTAHAQVNISNDKALQNYAYLAMMDALGSMLITACNGYDGTAKAFDASKLWTVANIDWTRSEATQQGIESLFINMTLSLMTNEVFLKDSSTASNIDVTITTFPLTYIYTPFDLLLPYGLSLLAAVISLLFAIYAFHLNGSSYQNVFSTFVRAANNWDIHLHVAAEDTGANPAPKEMKKMFVGGTVESIPHSRQSSWS